MPAINGDCSATSVNARSDSRQRPLSPAIILTSINTDDDVRVTLDTTTDTPSMESFSLLEGIQLDPRPTFVLEIAPHESSSHILVLNPALEARPNLYYALKNTTHILSEFTQLTQPIILHGLEWDHYTIGGKWRVMSTGAQSADIQSPWSGSASIRTSKYSENHGNIQIHSMNSSLKRKSSDKGLTSRLTSPPAPFNIPEEFEHFLSLFNWSSMKLGPIHTWQRQLREVSIAGHSSSFPISLETRVQEYAFKRQA